MPRLWTLNWTYYFWSRLMPWKANYLHFWAASSSHSAATQESRFPKLEYCGVCFKSKGGKPGVVRYQVRGKRVARDSEKAHKVYSKCTPKLVTTTEAGKLNRIQYAIKAQCEGTRRRLVFERMKTNLEKQLKMRGFNRDPLK